MVGNWVKVVRLPVYTWTPSTFKKVASTWGYPLFVDYNADDPTGISIVFIRTKCMEKVHCKFKVDVNGENYMEIFWKFQIGFHPLCI